MLEWDSSKASYSGLHQAVVWVRRSVRGSDTSTASYSDPRPAPAKKQESWLWSAASKASASGLDHAVIHIVGLAPQVLGNRRHCSAHRLPIHQVPLEHI